MSPTILEALAFIFLSKCLYGEISNKSLALEHLVAEV